MSEEVKKIKKPSPIKKDAKKPQVNLFKGSSPPTGSSTDNRPIKGNPTGKYNMKFIDWTNEFEAIAEYMCDPEATENPCGLDEREFEQVIVFFLDLKNV